MISPSSILAQIPDQTSSAVGEEIIILKFKSGTYYGLNSVGARVWQLIQSPKTFSEICEVILTEYEVELEQCKDDVNRLLNQLITEGLVEVERETSA